MLDTTLGKGEAAKIFMLIYEQCLLSACPFECFVPLLARTLSKVRMNVVFSGLFPFKISPSGDV